MSWTLFWDMCSGGYIKEAPYEKIYIEAPEAEAEVIFYNRFGHGANQVTCGCCGEDYSVSESETLEEATDYHRKPFRKKEVTLSAYEKHADVLIIRADDILPSEREGEAPEGYYP